MTLRIIDYADDCLETSEQIKEYNNEFYLQSDYDTLTQTPEYIAEQKAKNNAIIKQDILKQLSEIDAKSIRALRDGDTAYIAQYKAQAQDLREQLNATV